MSETDPTEEIASFRETFVAVKAELAKIIVGQDAMIHRTMLALLTGGHVLLEGVPGLAKTLTIQTLAAVIGGSFSRIQFTPDMLPGDVTGTQIFNPKEGSYAVKKGPIFGNLVLADEINRAPSKVQAALLEAMQEGQVTLGEETFQLPNPFLVMATQNPIEQEGTYQLPEAQLDRFMIKVKVDYPTPEEEVKILDRMTSHTSLPQVNSILSTEDILKARGVVRRIFVDDKVKRYVVNLVNASRVTSHTETQSVASATVPLLKDLIETGASPRASINLIKLAKANAFWDGRNYVSPHDVKLVAADVLRHRIGISYEAEAQEKNADDIIEIILDNVEVP